ncbi:hypothetical protein [Lagierella sp.]|uniref:COG1361 S-layer family protein n=1 Tax=Lagierella sp. TaxID=2849657 RepID=UPI00262FA55A|nr:hypothetical protein [Lagierella sp.]
MKRQLLSILLIISLLAITNFSFAKENGDMEKSEIQLKDYKIEQVIKDGKTCPKFIEKDTEFTIFIYPENMNYDILSTYCFTMVPNQNFKVLSSKVEKAKEDEKAVIVFKLKALEKLDKDNYNVEILGTKIKDNLSLKTDLAFKDVDFKNISSNDEKPTNNDNSNNSVTDSNKNPNASNNTNSNDKGGDYNMISSKDNTGKDQNTSIQGADQGNDNSNPSVKNKPKLIIDNYSLNPKMVEAGKEFTLNMSFFNTNSSYSVRNIKISLNNETSGSGTNGETVGGSVFIPVGSSNTFYINRIAPGRSVSKSMKMSVVPNAQAQNYVITANFEYEDKEGNEFTASEIIGIPVVQQAKVSFGEVTTNPGMAGEPATVDMDFFNTGKDTLSNFMVQVQGDGFSLDGSSNYFVGNFAPGASDHFSTTIIPTESGTINGKVLVTYEDSTGQSHTEEKPFNMEASTMDESTEVPPEMEEGNSTNSLGKLPIILGGLIILGIIIGIIYKKKKDAKKKGSDLQI